MKSRVLIGLSVLSTVALSACGLFKSDKANESEKKPAPQAPKLIGRIASVPADKRFVLIQSYGSWNSAPGTILTTRGPEERTANLLVTGESLGQFAAADLQSGVVDVGDAVYFQPPSEPLRPIPDSEASSQVPEIQQESTSENVQKNN